MGGLKDLEPFEFQGDKLSPEQVSECINYALDFAGAKPFDTKSLEELIKFSSKPLREIHFANYVNAYRQKAQEITGKTHAFYQWGDIAVINCAIKGGELSTSGLKTLRLINCEADSIKGFSKVIAKSSNLKAIEAQTIECYECEIGTLQLSANGGALRLEKTVVDAWNVLDNENVILLKNVTFKQLIKNAHRLKISANSINLSNVKFDIVDSDKAIATFRTLKKKCADSDYEHGVILFHAYELEAYYNVYLRKQCPRSQLPEKFSHLLHKGCTDYGRDILLPFLCLFYLFVSGTYINLAYIDYSVINAILLSFKHSVGPMTFALNTDIWKDLEPKAYNLLGFAQVIFSSIIWFLIIFMIRRRFKI